MSGCSGRTPVEEEDRIPLSALQHWTFCPRQCALIHLDGVWGENRLTAQGHLLHDRVHAHEKEVSSSRLLVRGLWLSSGRLGVRGIADSVEFFREEAPKAGGAVLPGRDGRWRAFPVEYKRGRPKRHDADRVQLCAQAICLEEMLATSIASGALYYGATRRREGVTFDQTLREKTLRIAAEARDALSRKRLPQPTRGPTVASAVCVTLAFPSAPIDRAS